MFLLLALKYLRFFCNLETYNAIHQFLFALEEAEEEIQVRVDDEDIVQLSDGLSGESFGEMAGTHSLVNIECSNVT